MKVRAMVPDNLVVVILAGGMIGMVTVRLETAAAEKGPHGGIRQNHALPQHPMSGI